MLLYICKKGKGNDWRFDIMLFLKKRKPVETVPTAMDIAREELYAAIAQRNLVLANFDNVAPEYFEIANADQIGRAHV